MEQYDLSNGVLINVFLFCIFSSVLSVTLNIFQVKKKKKIVMHA